METEHRIEARGATLFYKTRGSGPALLVIQGGAADANGSDAIAEELEDAFTIVSYDRRGLSRSRVSPGSEPTDLGVHGDDAALILRSVTTEPAYVFGVSIGGLIGLDLVSRDPDAVRLAVIHEAPTTQLLPDVIRERAVQEQGDVEAAYRQDGVRAAMMRFLQISGVDFADREDDAPVLKPSPFLEKNLEFFLTYDAPAVRKYQLDVETLRRRVNKVIPAAGETSSSNWPHLCASRLADKLGVPLVEFPGGHNAYGSRPTAVARRLREIFVATH